jgi:ribosomal protein S18 acetylase RimI-like enzyme
MIEEAINLNEILPLIREYFPKYVISNNPYEKNYVYKIDGEIVGFISFSVIYERCEINYIFSKYKRKGIGSKLLNFCFGFSSDISLEVNIDNKEAIDFYLENGFKIISIRKNYYDSNDAYLMIRR